MRGCSPQEPSFVNNNIPQLGVAIYFVVCSFAVVIFLCGFFYCGGGGRAFVKVVLLALKLLPTCMLWISYACSVQSIIHILDKISSYM